MLLAFNLWVRWFSTSYFTCGLVRRRRCLRLPWIHFGRCRVTLPVVNMHLAHALWSNLMDGTAENESLWSGGCWTLILVFRMQEVYDSLRDAWISDQTCKSSWQANMSSLTISELSSCMKMDPHFQFDKSSMVHLNLGHMVFQEVRHTWLPKCSGVKISAPKVSTVWLVVLFSNTWNAQYAQSSLGCLTGNPISPFHRHVSSNQTTRHPPIDWDESIYCNDSLLMVGWPCPGLFGRPVRSFWNIQNRTRDTR